MHKVWSRPGLATRDRRLVTIAVLAMEGASRELDVHLRAALLSGDLDATELDELSIQMAMYGGWPRGAAVQTALAGVLAEPGPAPTHDMSPLADSE
jgi:4-carboxymuconolactone decarboxylase